MSLKSKRRNIRLIARSVDLAAIVACFAAAGAIATFMQQRGLFIWPRPQPNDIAGWPAHYAILLIASLSLWASVSGHLRLYDSNQEALAAPSFRQLIRAIVLWLGIIISSIFLLKLRGLSRQFTVTFFTFASFSILFRNLFQSRILRRAGGRTHQRNAIVVGDASSALGLTQLLDSVRAYDSVALAEESADSLMAAPTAANSTRSASLTINRSPDIFLLSGSGTSISHDTILKLLKEQRVVHIVPALIDAALFRLSISEIGGVPVVTLSAGQLSRWQTASKRLLDLVVTAAALMMFAPLMALIAIAIRLTSFGPIFFRQERLGQSGRRFRIFKFRTMRQDAEAILKANPELYIKYRNSNFKLSKDEDFRVTPLGRFLRASSLDELPQLLNVLIGDMSLVGPRPIVPDEIERYDDYAKLLLSVKPGITGYWQVNGRSLISDYAARVRLDMEYIRDQSLRADLQIMLKTVSAVTRIEGAH
jgi:exopolysaccharide production protein ExoY